MLRKQHFFPGLAKACSFSEILPSLEVYLKVWSLARTPSKKDTFHMRKSRIALAAIRATRLYMTWLSLQYWSLAYRFFHQASWTGLEAAAFSTVKTSFAKAPLDLPQILLASRSPGTIMALCKRKTSCAFYLQHQSHSLPLSRELRAPFDFSHTVLGAWYLLHIFLPLSATASHAACISCGSSTSYSVVRDFFSFTAGQSCLLHDLALLKQAPWWGFSARSTASIQCSPRY